MEKLSPTRPKHTAWNRAWDFSVSVELSHTSVKPPSNQSVAVNGTERQGVFAFSCRILERIQTSGRLADWLTPDPSPLSTLAPPAGEDDWM